MEKEYNLYSNDYANFRKQYTLQQVVNRVNNVYSVLIKTREKALRINETKRGLNQKRKKQELCSKSVEVVVEGEDSTIRCTQCHPKHLQESSRRYEKAKAESKCDDFGPWLL